MGGCLVRFLIKRGEISGRRLVAPSKPKPTKPYRHHRLPPPRPLAFRFHSNHVWDGQWGLVGHEGSVAVGRSIVHRLSEVSSFPRRSVTSGR